MSKQKPKTGMARMMQLAMTKKLLVIASVILSSLAAVASFIPYIAIYFIIRQILAVYPDLSALGQNQPVFLRLDGAWRRCGEYRPVFCRSYVFPSGGLRHAV